MIDEKKEKSSQGEAAHVEREYIPATENLSDAVREALALWADDFSVH